MLLGGVPQSPWDAASHTWSPKIHQVKQLSLVRLRRFFSQQVLRFWKTIIFHEITYIPTLHDPKIPRYIYTQEKWVQISLQRTFMRMCLTDLVTIAQGRDQPKRLSRVQFRHSVVSNSLRPHELQHTRSPCPSPTPRVHPKPCALSQWCHPTILSSVIPFSFCP